MACFHCVGDNDLSKLETDRIRVDGGIERMGRTFLIFENFRDRLLIVVCVSEAIRSALAGAL